MVGFVSQLWWTGLNEENPNNLARKEFVSAGAKWLAHSSCPVNSERYPARVGVLGGVCDFYTPNRASRRTSDF